MTSIDYADQLLALGGSTQDPNLVGIANSTNEVPILALYDLTLPQSSQLTLFLAFLFPQSAINDISFNPEKVKIICHVQSQP